MLVNDDIKNWLAAVFDKSNNKIPEITTEATDFFDVIDDLFKEGFSLDSIISDLDIADETLLKFITDTEQLGNISLPAYKKYAAGVNSLGKTFNFAALRATLVVAAINIAIQMAYKAIDDYIHRLENAKDALAETQSESGAIQSELDTTKEKIEELESLNSLSLTDKEDLEQLKLQNKELEIRQKYLEKQEALEIQKVADLSKEKYNLSYSGAGNRELINEYKELLSAPPKSNSNQPSTYLTGESSTPTNQYAAGLQPKLHAGSESLDALIAKYEVYQEKKKEALQHENLEDVDKYTQELVDVSLKLMNFRRLLDNHKDDIGATGEESPELDALISQLQLIDDTLFTKGEKFEEFLNADSFAESKQNLIELASEGKLTADHLSNHFKDLDSYMKDNGITVDELIDQLKTLDETTAPSSISETIKRFNTQLKPAFDSLKAAYQNIFTDNGFTLENVDLDMLERIRSSFEGMEQLGLDIDYSSIDQFANVLTDISSNEEDVKNAFNEMAASITSNLSGISEENYNVAQAMLESFGIANSQIVAFNALISNTEVLARITDEGAEAFVNEHVAAEYAGQALALLQLKKLLVNGTSVNTSNDIGQIMSLASAAGIGAEVLVQLANAKSILSIVENGGTVSLASYEKAMSDIESAKQKISDWEPVEIKFDGNSAAKSAGAAGKEAADAYLDTFEKELSNLKSLRDRGKITEKQYLDHLRKLYEVYFKNKKKYLDQYQKYEAEYLSGMKSLYESAFSGIISILDKQIEVNNKQKDASIDSLNEQKEAAEESYKAQQKLLDEQIDAIQKQIDIKQKEIDAINEAAESRKREIELQKAQYELERAKNQRTKYVYKDGGGGYEIDSSAVTDARQNLDDAVKEQNIAGIEKEISLLEGKINVLEEQKAAIDSMIESSNSYYDGLIKQSENYWDSIIHGLEDYKSRWEELAELEEQAKMLSVLEQLGISTEDILGMSESAFQDFKNNYLNILADIYSGNDQMTKSLSELTNVNMGSLNGYLAETQGYIDGLKGINYEELTESMATIGESFGNVSNSVGDAVNAISGGGSSASGTSPDGSSEPTEGNSSSSLKSAIEEQVNSATEQLTKEAELFKGEGGIKGAVQEVIDKIGGGGKEDDDPSGEDSDTLTSAIQNQVDTANKLIPQEKVLFQDLSDVMGNAKDHISEIKTMLEDMDGKEFTVTLNVNGGGGLPNLPGHASGIKKIGKDETAWTQEAGREMIISPSTGAVLTPLSQGDSVLKNSFTENIFEWAKINPSIFVASLKSGNTVNYMPEGKPQTVSIEQKVEINAPYLTNTDGYNRLVAELQGLELQAYQYAMKK